MRIIKTIIKLMLTVMMVITSLHVYALPVKAASSEGKAFGVLQDDGELLIIRSNDPFDEYTFVYEDTTITDIFGKEYTGTVFYGAELGVFQWTSYNEEHPVKSFRIEDGIVFKPITMDGMFYGLNQLESVSFEWLDASSVTGMSVMFSMCENLKNIRFPDNIDTSKVISFESMFSSCHALETVDISGFDFSSAENMRDMFNSCWNLKGVKLPVNAKTDKVKDFRFMFYDCFALEELDLSGFNTRSAETMSNMFGYCQKLRKLDISSFDTRKTDRDYGVQYMLYEMNKLEELKVGPYFENWNNVYLAQGRWKNGSLTKTTDELVRGYPGNATAWAGTWVRDFDLIENLVLNGYEPLMPGETGRVYFYTEPYENVKTDLVWSSSDESVATVDENGIVSAKKVGETVITAKTTDGSNLESSIKVIVREDIAYGILSDEGEMVLIRAKAKYNSSIHEKVTITDINGVSYTGYLYCDIESHDSPDWYQWFSSEESCIEKIKKFRIAEGMTIKPIRFSWWLSDATNLEEVDFTGIDTSEVTDFNGLFYKNSKLKKVNFGTMDTSVAESMYSMFEKCDSLEEISFGEKFTKYIKGTELPPGIWSNGTQSYRDNEFEEKFSADTAGLTGTWTRTVIKATSFNIIPDELTLYVGAWGQFEYEFKPDDATISIEWSSSDEEGLYVWDSSSYERKKVGTYTVTAHTTEGSDLTDTVTVTVVEPEYCNVTFITYSEETPDFTVQVRKGDMVDCPADPVWSGHKFAGWMDNPEGTVSFDFGTIITEDRYVYAGWIYPYQVWFAYENGEPESYQDVIPGERVIKPADPVKDGYNFIGWYYFNDAGEEVPYDFSTPVVNNGFTLFAHWELVPVSDRDYYMIFFELNGGIGETPAPVKVKKGDKYTVPELMFKAPVGKAFVDWTVVSAATNTMTGEYPKPGDKIEVKEDLVLWPSWVDISYRLAGNNRYDTAIKAAELLMEKYEMEKLTTVVLTTGNNFADALSGGYLAEICQAPILLTREESADTVNKWIKKNLMEGGTIYVLGGTSAVSDKCLKGLEGFNIDRIAGDNRYETNIKILKKAKVTDQDILVCTGNNFADSLSASAVGLPILLVKDELNDRQRNYLKTLSTSKFYVIGGTAAVSNTVMDQVKKYGSVSRIAGNNRYETSVEIARKFIPAIPFYTRLVLAYAQNFPDGLCGGPLAYAFGSPVILTKTGNEKVAADYGWEIRSEAVIVLGGEGLISDDAARKIIWMTSAEKIYKR